MRRRLAMWWVRSRTLPGWGCGGTGALGWGVGRGPPMGGSYTSLGKTSTMSDTIFCAPDLTAFCRLDELGTVPPRWRSHRTPLVLRRMSSRMASQDIGAAAQAGPASHAVCAGRLRPSWSTISPSAASPPRWAWPRTPPMTRSWPKADRS